MRCPVAALGGCSCQDATVSLSAGGQIGYKCHVCGASGFMPKGSKSFRFVEKFYTKDDDAAPPAAAPGAAPAAAPTPPAKPARPAFALGNL